MYVPLKHYWYTQGNILDDMGKLIKVVSLNKKRPLFIEALFWFYLTKCFLVPTYLVKPLLHTYISYSIFFISVEEVNGIIHNWHM